MRERKKYLVNILSYKYKKDSMKLFPSILSKNKILSPTNIDLDIPITNDSNLCPGGKNCQNFIIICHLEKQIKSLNDTIYQLKQINEYCDIKVNDLPFSELKINESLMSEKSDKTSELCNSFRNSSIKRSNSAFDDKLYNQNNNKSSSRFRTLSNDSDSKNKGEFNYMRNRIKCFNLNKELNSSNLNFSESEKQFSQESKIKACKIFQSNFLNKKNINKKEDEKEKDIKDINIEKNNRIFNINNNKIFFRNKNEENSYDKIKESEPCFSPPIKILKNNLFGVNNNINMNKEIKFLKTSDNEINKNNQGSKNKINYFNGLKAFRQIKNPIKFNLNNNNNNERLSNHKFNQINPDNNKNINSIDNPKMHKISNNNNSELILKEFNNFIKNYEYKSNYKNGELIFNRLYELTSPKDKKVLDNIKSLSDEDIYKYSSLINYSLKYISNITLFIQKIKYFCNYNSNQYINIFFQQNKNNKEILKEEFYKYKEECKNLLNCEKVNIYLYDSNSDCLILKEENSDKKYPKDKDLIGLSFTSCKKIRHDPSLSSCQIFSTLALEQRLKMKINNLLIFPIKDREKNIHGIIEVINKIKEDNNKNNNKSFFDKNDELLLDLITGNIGNFCKYFNIIENQNININNYHYILEFWNKLFYKSSYSPSLYLIIEEFTKLMKKIYNVNEIQFLLYINQNLYDIQKNKIIELDGLLYKCLQEKKIIFSSDPLSNKNYKINIDLPVINNYKDNQLLNREQLITFPVFYDSLEDNDNKKIQNILMIIQIKAKNIVQLTDINKEDEELNEENKIIIEYSSYLIQKYLEENKEIINKFKYLI